LNLPRDGSKVGKGNTKQKGQTTTNDATKRGDARSLGGHATNLKVQSTHCNNSVRSICEINQVRTVSNAQNDNGAPVPENGIGKGRQGSGVGHLIGKDALVTKGVGTILSNTS